MKVRVAAVYFICDEHKRVKIGWAFDPESRLKQLQGSNGDRLKILAIIQRSSENSAITLEKALHNTFFPLHLRGEWYKLQEPLISYVQAATHNPLFKSKQLKPELTNFRFTTTKDALQIIANHCSLLAVVS